MLKVKNVDQPDFGNFIYPQILLRNSLVKQIWTPSLQRKFPDGFKNINLKKIITFDRMFLQETQT